MTHKRIQNTCVKTFKTLFYISNINTFPIIKLKGTTSWLANLIPIDFFCKLCPDIIINLKGCLIYLTWYLWHRPYNVRQMIYDVFYFFTIKYLIQRWMTWKRTRLGVKCVLTLQRKCLLSYPYEHIRIGFA